MYSDARSLWNTVAGGVQNAAGAVQNIQQNISTALENIDLDAAFNEEEESEGGPSSSKGVKVEHLEAELESYKGLLDEAQVKIYELSKETQVLIGRLHF